MQFKLAARRYISELHATPWHHVFGYALLLLFFGKLIASMMPAGLRSPLNSLVPLAAALMFVAKDLVGTPQLLQRARSHRSPVPTRIYRSAKARPRVDARLPQLDYAA